MLILQVSGVLMNCVPSFEQGNKLMFTCTAGSDRFYMNIEDMIGYKPIFFIKWCWMILTPGICAVSLTQCTKSIYHIWKWFTAKTYFINDNWLWCSLCLRRPTATTHLTHVSNVGLHLLQGIFLFFLIKYKPLKYNNVYTYPDWGYGIGWFMAMSSMVCIPLGIIWMIWKTPGTFTEVKTMVENMCFKFILSFYGNYQNSYLLGHSQAHLIDPKSVLKT